MTSSRDRFDLWPRPYRLRGVVPPTMQLSQDIRRCIAFLGAGTDGEFKPVGTGFFVGYEGGRYMVTAKHVAARLTDPFRMRINKLDGGSDLFHTDPDEVYGDGISHPWFFHPDPTVDVAIQPAHVGFRQAGYDLLMIPPTLLEPPAEIIGVGDFCYAIGLFRLVAGSERNVPIVHTGNIALMPGEEKITVTDPMDLTERRTVLSDGYLVEMANLPGLSGAPVLARATMSLTFAEGFFADEPIRVSCAKTEVTLLGVWTASWDGKRPTSDDTTSHKELRVPVGMGLVTPTSKIVELLQSEAVVAERKKANERMQRKLAAKLD